MLSYLKKQNFDAVCVHYKIKQIGRDSFTYHVVTLFNDKLSPIKKKLSNQKKHPLKKQLTNTFKEMN